MKTSVLDFIDSATLREHLCNQQQEPAVECLLIVHCKTRSNEEKLEALKERYEAYSAEDFKKGTYHCRENDFKSALKEYIDSTEKAIADMYCSDADYIYHIEEIFDNLHCRGIFDSFDKALTAIETKEFPKIRLVIRKARINEFVNLAPTRAFINEQGIPYDILDFDSQLIFYSLNFAYAWIPHRYAIGDIICSNFDHSFAVVVDYEKCPADTTGLDFKDMTLKCVRFDKNEYHSCGGVFIQEDIHILCMESGELSDLKGCPKELIKISHFIKGGISAAEFLDEYSQGLIPWNTILHLNKWRSPYSR